MDRSDFYHQSAKALWPALLEDAISLQTSNYVVSETLSLIQYRLGYKAASLWYKDILGVLEVHWVKQATHQQAYQLWMSFGRRHYSLVDCISFEIMEARAVTTAYTYDKHFMEYGFTIADF